MIIAVVILSVLTILFAVGSAIFFFRWRKTFIALRLAIAMLETVQEDYEIPDWQLNDHYLTLAHKKVTEEIEKATRKKNR